MIQLRPTTTEDIETITTHRIQMFIDMGEHPAQMETIRESYCEWLRAGNLEGKRAMIFNMYAAPGSRRRGIARQIAEALLRIAAQRGIPVVTLHASDEGRPLYERLGFQRTNEMRLTITRTLE